MTFKVIQGHCHCG